MQTLILHLTMRIYRCRLTRWLDSKDHSKVAVRLEARHADGGETMCRIPLDPVSAIVRHALKLLYPGRRTGFMKFSKWMTSMWVLMFATSGLQSASAQLPTLNQYPWLGYFAGFSNRNCMLGLLTTGEINLTVLDAKKEPLHPKLVIPVVLAVEETLPNGKTVIRKIQSDSLKSAQAATERLKKVVIRGKVEGDTAFELTLEQSRGMVLLGGRVLDSGPSKNPLRLGVRASFSTPYPYSKEIPNEKAAEIFRKKIKGDGIALKWTDKQARTFAIDQEINAASSEVNGPGIAEAEIKVCSYDGRKFVFLASPNSAMTLENKPGQTLSKGFSLVWHPNPAKDPEGIARLAIDVR